MTEPETPAEPLDLDAPPDPPATPEPEVASTDVDPAPLAREELETMATVVAAAMDEPAATKAYKPRRSAWLGSALIMLGSFATLFMMSLESQLPRGTLWGGLTVALAAAGVLELFGLLRANAADLPVGSAWFGPKPGEPTWMAPQLTLPLSLLILAVGGMAVGIHGLPWIITAALLVLAASSLQRPALFVFVSGSLLILPLLGQYGLWDPWETHYGEVAREILARDDWITLWWAQDEWFRSKPVFIFWSEALTWSALGMPFAPDSNPSHPEWALRLPIYALSIGALLASYAAIARVFGRRAGVLAALVLATTPYFFFLSHQAITDMPFVATMTIALALLLIALEEPETREAVRYRLGPLQISWQSVVIVAFVMVALPQALYLITRNLTFVIDQKSGFWLHRDVFQFGSAGNGGISGNAALRTRGPHLTVLWAQPLAQGLLWLLGLVGLLWMLRKERRTQQLAMFGFYLFCSFAWMAKGIPGFALPGLIAGFYLVATGRWSLLISGKLRIAAGMLTIAVTGLPWYVAMYGRLGPFFTDRLLIHDHINRLASGVHGDTGSIQYFLWQLGYGAFPWLGLAPAAFVCFIAVTRADKPEDESRRRSLLLIAMWWIAGFALFNGMITKFHHYIFPTIPPMAMAIGVLLDQMLGQGQNAQNRVRRIMSHALCALAPLPLLLGTAGLWGSVRGVIPESVVPAQRATWVELHPWNGWLCAALITLGVLLFLLALAFSGDGRPRERRPEDAAFSVTLIAGAILAAFAGRDLSWTTTEHPLGHERLIDLFVYNYQRPFPDHLDYRASLAGFSIVIFVLTITAALPFLRKTALYGLLGCAVWFSAWSLDVYMMDLSPHWGQRELVKRYYAQRKSAKEPLVAWQMNWKGENLYSGNHVHVFIQLDNKQITEWLANNQHKNAYFLLEHSRLGNFKRLLGQRKVEELSTPRENNKFILVRAQI